MFVRMLEALELADVETWEEYGATVNVETLKVRGLRPPGSPGWRAGVRQGTYRRRRTFWLRDGGGVGLPRSCCCWQLRAGVWIFGVARAGVLGWPVRSCAGRGERGNRRASKIAKDVPKGAGVGMKTIQLE